MLTTAQVIAELKTLSPRAIRLNFSTGEDSLALWLALRGCKLKIVPIYFYIVPELAFVERTLSMYEDFFGQPIARLPHPLLERLLNRCDLQDPIGYLTLYDLDWPQGESFDEIGEHYMRELDFPNCWTCVGVRAWDSINRRMVMRKHGELRPKHRLAFPIAWHRQADVTAAISDSGAPISEDYKVFGRSFDGLDYRFLKPIRDHYPDDFARILTWFPLAEAEILRGEMCHA